MARFVSPAVIGGTDAVHDEALNALGTVATDTEGRQWIYLEGVASTVEGSWVTYSEAGATALLAANAVGPVAVAGAAIVADKFGWYCIFAPLGVSASIAANSADNSPSIGREGADGVAGDGRAAGDAIQRAITREATTSAANVLVQIFYPHVDDATGA